MVREIDLAAFAAAHRDGGFVVDVREPHEYVAGHVPGAQLIPLSRVHSRIADLPKDRPVFVICAGGNRSKSATDWMRSAGVDAYSVMGGTNGWLSAGYPSITGPQANAA